jgi:hypothetical protein
VTRIEGSWLRDAKSRWVGRFAAGLAGIAALSVGIHWLAFHFAQLPLPLGRKAIYLVPLTTLIFGIIAAAPARSVVSRWLRGGLTAVFICLAGYYLLCLRLTYFQEWQWDADLKDVYHELARYNHVYGVTDVGTSWFCVASLNYYREVSKQETFPEFTTTIPYPPPGKAVYVLNKSFDQEFLDKEKLVVIYQGKSTGAVIAIRPDGPIPAAN